ncbi:hypothetical protein [Xanthomonas vesicatoria]|uniref:Uncharacterized protein n=1 Tax=Xanthomonas vesicatoria TaxID=56460 RepID=A0ABS8LBM7_9XANT|nr:hypothetical protein [Xanthomonas vesicatoria]MCC8559688.1 hypothetical protein [Xanthomonas vesicatoria]MCC8595342.1 hypothetical protein [Xanthomonas vesicatoria]MCC8602827.1 hypothetical protein [Xanthomonas vesicatoria]MCC8604126.1 hypothetical protein [Xanthomonas vesicatoria]MCC8611191.1 hypothetical protein [Xanthomonas vesicatoria]
MATLSEAWQFLNASDRLTSDDKRSAFRKIRQLEMAVAAEPFSAATPSASSMPCTHRWFAIPKRITVKRNNGSRLTFP